MTLPEALARPLRVVVTRRLQPAVEARMRDLFGAVLNADDRQMTRDALVAAMSNADVLVPAVTDTIDAAMISAAGDGLRLIANFGAGTNHIDLAAAAARGIVVTNTPDVFTDDTADLTMALIIAVPRRLGEGARELHEGRWEGWGPSGLLGRTLRGKVLGIVGMGRIGQAVAARAKAFGLEIVYHNRSRLPTEVEDRLGARYEADLGALIARSDILTLHCPAGQDTRHLLDAQTIAAMKPGACVINTGRGDLIDEDALIAALAAGHLGGAGLDVFADEPAVDPRLLALPGVIAIPHMGSATREGREAAGHRIIANILAWAEGDEPADRVA